MADAAVDCMGMSCPMPIVKVSRAIKSVSLGEKIVVTSDDPAFRPDIEAWSEKTGNPILKFEENNGVFTAVIERTS